MFKIPGIMLKAGLAHWAPPGPPPGRLLSGRRGVSPAQTPCWWQLVQQLLVSRTGNKAEVPASAAEPRGEAGPLRGAEGEG